MTIDDFVLQIDAFNRCWKIASERHGPDSSFARMLRRQKTNLQVELIRVFPSQVTLVEDAESDDYAEAQFSLRLSPPVQLLNGSLRRDANHLPKRLAVEYLPVDFFQLIETQK